MFELLGCKIAVDDVNEKHMSAIIRTESSAYQNAVGVVSHYLSRQPNSKEEALTLVKFLKAKKIDYSVGLAQINQSNFSAYGLTMENMFDPCTNITAGSLILKKCFNKYGSWEKAYSCYYSGNPTTGLKHGYVSKVKRNLFVKTLTEIKSEKKSSSPLKIYPRSVKSMKTIVISNRFSNLLTRRLASSLSEN